MVNPIVIVNVSQQVAPTPSILQQTGALISQGGTVQSIGTFSFLTELADLTPLLQPSVNLASLTWSSTGGGTLTGTTGTAIGLAVGTQFLTTIAGVTPSIVNGTYLATVTGTKSFAFAYATNPGTVTAAGNYSPQNAAELVAMATTFFSQGAVQGVYVLELGAGDVPTAIGNLNTFIQNNSPQIFYSYLVPRSWDGNATYLAFLSQFENNTAKTYFFTTTTLQNKDLYTALMKDVFSMVECPQLGVNSQIAITNAVWSAGQITLTSANAHGLLQGMSCQLSGFVPVMLNQWWTLLPGTSGSTMVIGGPQLVTNPGAVTTQGVLLASQYVNAGIPLAFEFSLASAFHVTLSYAPSSTNKVTPLSFAFLFGVTPFPTRGMAPTLSAMRTGNVNYVGTGAEGGISNTVLYWGNTEDGNQFNYWYSVDWVQINLDLNIANAVINGSNNPVNPLYYDQDGINALQQVAAATLSNAISFGMAIGSVIQVGLDGTALDKALDSGQFANVALINAVPFLIYTRQIPGDYKIGRYAGFTAIYTPARGFEQIVFNLVVSQFVAL